MTINKLILKNTRRQAVVKLLGTGPETIDIYELAYHDQTVDAANVSLTITDIAFVTGEAGNIVRNGNTIFTLPSGAYQEFNFTATIGTSLNDDADGNVVVNLGANVESTVILQFSKEAGYDDPDRQTLLPFQR